MNKMNTDIVGRYNKKMNKIMGDEKLLKELYLLADTIIENDICYKEAGKLLNFSKYKVSLYINDYLSFIDEEKYKKVKETMKKNITKNLKRK